MKYEQHTPDGYYPIPVREVYTNGNKLVVLGNPDENEDEESTHNCDAMGCSSCGNHVLFITELPEWQKIFAEAYRPNHPWDYKPEAHDDYTTETVRL